MSVSGFHRMNKTNVSDANSREGRKNAVRMSRIALLIAVAALGFAPLVSADPVVTDPMTTVTITATSDCGTGQFTFTVPEGLGAQGYEEYVMNVPVTIYSASGAALAEVKQLKVGIDQDPDVWLYFSVRNANATPTSFTYTSNLVTFSPLVNPRAYATAGITLTDTDSNGATLTGLYSGGKAYRALYDNTTSTIQTWAYLCGSGTAATDSTSVWSDRVPALGWSSISGSVFNIQSQFSFSLSAYDEASGTSDFKVLAVPEPATMTLLGSSALALVGGWWRRRSK